METKRRRARSPAHCLSASLLTPSPRNPCSQGCADLQARSLLQPLLRTSDHRYPGHGLARDDLPGYLTYHPNWKGGLTHPAAITRSSVVDDVNPGAWGGDWSDDENPVTACWPCHGSKADLTLEPAWLAISPADPRHRLGRSFLAIPSPLDCGGLPTRPRPLVERLRLLDRYSNRSIHNVQPKLTNPALLHVLCNRPANRFNPFVISWPRRSQVLI